ncbi:nuclear pore complex protein Nup107-like [Diadema antillarum]|uniref:nuclear pore complex protein Nup107-like n=1 Tax=Diadema antillarum TaxID=105358 RepID=UPI003A85CBE0
MAALNKNPAGSSSLNVERSVRKGIPRGRYFNDRPDSPSNQGNSTIADIWEYSHRPGQAVSFDPEKMNRSIDQRRENRHQARHGDLSFSLLNRSIEPREEVRSNILQHDRIRKSIGLLEHATGIQGTPGPVSNMWPYNQGMRTAGSEMRRRTYTPQKPPMTSEFDVSDTIGITPGRSFLTSSTKLSSSVLEPTRDLQASLVSSPHYNSLLDHTEMTEDMTRANLLLQEDPGQLATEGMYNDFLAAFKKHQSLVDVFTLVGEYERLCHEQVAMLNHLIAKTVPGQKSFSRTLQVLRLLNQEKATWRLIASLYQDRQMAADDPDDMLSITVDRIHTEQLSEREITDGLFEKDAMVRQHQIIVDWLESVTADQLAMSQDKVPFYSQSVCWENTLHALQQRVVSGSTSSRESTVSSLDPDAPIRENRPLADLDKEDELRLLHSVFSMIRAGKLEEAQRLCKDSGQAWRAASLEGWRLYHDRNMASVDNSGDLAPIEGNPYRDIWKSVCWRMSEDERFHFVERAIYAALSGNLRELLPACDLWEDCLWAYFKVLVDQEVEREIRAQLRPDRPLQNLPQGYYMKDLTPPQIFQELHAHPNQNVEAQAKEKMHLVQKYIILGDVDTLLEEMNDWLCETSSRPSHHLVRFMAHLALILRALGLQTREEICTSIIEAYVKDLLADQRTELVAMYVAQLPPDLQVTWYAKFLEGVTDRDQRQYCLQLAEDAGLDVAAITKRVVETLRFKEEEQPDVADSAAYDSATSQEDRRKIEAIDWLVFDPSQRAEAVKQSNAIIRAFLATKKHDAARAVFRKLPEDSIDIIHRNWRARVGSVPIPPQDDNAIREYLCIKAYLDALDAYNDWFALYHHKKPTEPSLPGDANFHERVRFEHEHKEYEMELDRWQQTLMVQTKGVSDTIYNVLLFLDGGWMVDQRQEEEVDDLRKNQMERLRQLCLPRLCLLLHSVLHATQQYKDSLVLADIVASEQYQLYTVFSKPELRQLLSKLRESSLQLLDQNLDALGYEIAS